MLRILLIEDEEPAAKRLEKMIREAEPQADILAVIASASSAISWFAANEEPDLIFSDIQLADGTSFDVFREVNVKCPVIFVTAYFFAAMLIVAKAFAILLAILSLLDLGILFFTKHNIIAHRSVNDLLSNAEENDIRISLYSNYRIPLNIS